MLSAQLFLTIVHLITAFLPISRMLNIYCAMNDSEEYRDGFSAEGLPLHHNTTLFDQGSLALSLSLSLCRDKHLCINYTATKVNLLFSSPTHPSPPFVFLLSLHLSLSLSPPSSFPHSLTGVVAGGVAWFCPSAFESRSFGGVCPRGSMVLNGSIHNFKRDTRKKLQQFQSDN